MSGAARIEVDHLTRRYGPVVAVNDVSFTVGAGEIVGFLGPNGAGKSTLMKVLCTWLPPSSGTIRVAGHDVTRDPLGVRRVLGYLPEHNALYEGMRVDRFLAFMGGMRGLSGRTLAERTAWVVETCNLAPVLGKRVEQCSKGYRQRVGLAAALIHDPPVIVLDEPTHGLDALQVVAFRDFVRALAPGRAILFSSHVLSEVLSISERVLVINEGRLLADRAVAGLHEQAGTEGRPVEDVVLDIVRARGPTAPEAAS